MNLGAIITPFLDMSFQILAFFIMTYHPSALEGHISGTLTPPSPKFSGDPSKAPAGSVDMPDLTETVTIRVKSVPEDGTPGQILVKRTADVNYQPVVDAGQPLTQGMARLETRLKDIIQRNPLDTAVKIEGDGDLRQQYVMLVYDVCRKAGFMQVGFVPPPLTSTNQPGAGIP